MCCFILNGIFQIRVDMSRPNESDKRYHVFDLEQQSWKNVVVFFCYNSILYKKITFDNYWLLILLFVNWKFNKF